jgi:hypothetical protein
VNVIPVLKFGTSELNSQKRNSAFELLQNRREALFSLCRVVSTQMLNSSALHKADPIFNIQYILCYLQAIIVI